jgi:hypothetical protein
MKKKDIKIEANTVNLNDIHTKLVDSGLFIIYGGRASGKSAMTCLKIKKMFMKKNPIKYFGKWFQGFIYERNN